MKLIRQIQSFLVVLSFAFLFSSIIADALVVQNHKDDIEIIVSSKIENTGKTLISCVLANNSQYTIAAINLQSRSSVFYFKLLDNTGKEIEHNPGWSKTFAQKSSERYRRPRSYGMDQVYSGKEIKFEFYLEDAYNLDGRNVQEILVSWESWYDGKTLITSDHRNAVGDTIKGTEEAYMFPERWDISVSLPLEEIGGGQPQTISGKSTGNAEALTKSPKEADTGNLMDRTSGNEKPQSSYRWWISIFPIAFLIIIALRVAHWIQKKRQA